MALPTSQSQISALHNCEHINSHCVKPQNHGHLLQQRRGANVGDVILTLILQIERLCMKGNATSQGHSVNKWQIQDLNPGILVAQANPSPK